jgi:hypothetical protein
MGWEAIPYSRAQPGAALGQCSQAKYASKVITSIECVVRLIPLCAYGWGSPCKFDDNAMGPVG